MIGVLVFTIGRSGCDLVDDAVQLLGERPEKLECLVAGMDRVPDKLHRELEQRLERLDDGGGVLILTDLFGATHANAACRLVRAGHVEMVSGVNLPMLLSVLTYRDLELDALTRKAIDGGNKGVARAPATRPERKVGS
jgi:PTS system ascorbate-specific IIA component